MYGALEIGVVPKIISRENSNLVGRSPSSSSNTSSNSFHTGILFSLASMVTQSPWFFCPVDLHSLLN